MRCEFTHRALVSPLSRVFVFLWVMLALATDQVAWPWSGELSGGVKINAIQYPVSGAGTVDNFDGLSLLGTLYASATQRGVIQIKLSGGALAEAQAQRVEFSTGPRSERDVQCSYQVYAPNGELLSNAFCDHGWLLVKNSRNRIPSEENEAESRERSLTFELNLVENGRSDRIEMSANHLLLIDPQSGAQLGDHRAESIPSSTQISVTAGDESALSIYDEYPDEDYFDEEGCDYENSEDVYESDDSISCESDIDEEGAERDGCTDDEWAAEATIIDQRKRSRAKLKRWRYLNRLLPIFFSFLFVFGWRRVSRLGNNETTNGQTRDSKRGSKYVLDEGSDGREGGSRVKRR